MIYLVGNYERQCGGHGDFYDVLIPCLNFGYFEEKEKAKSFAKKKGLKVIEVEHNISEIKFRKVYK